MRRFARFACLDWSGAAGATQRGIALAVCEPGDAAPVLVTPPAARWSRQAVLDWLNVQADAKADMLIGVDFSTALPFVDRGAYLPGWPEPMDEAPALWRLVDRLCGDDPHLGVTGFVNHAQASAHFRRAGGRAGAWFGGGIGRLRVVETICRAKRLGAAQSCFNLIGPAQVGKASLAGMRLLHRLGKRVPVWPVDPMPDAGPVIVEIYTAIAARAAGVTGGTKLRTIAALDQALAAPRIASRPVADWPVPGNGSLDDHRSDAILTAAWLRRAAGEDGLWRPPPIGIARTEGWTFGVALPTEAPVPA